MRQCSIAIPSYNRAEMLRAALESALSQTVDGLEILVIDDQSSNEVLRVARSFNDPRLVIIQNDRRYGLFGNFNRCIECSTGEYLRILCNDDELTPGCIERELAVMRNNPSVSLLFSKCEMVDGNGQLLGTVGNHFRPGLYHGTDAIFGLLWFFAHYWMNPIAWPSGVLLRRSALEAAGQFDSSFRMCGDVDLFLRVLRHGELAVLPEYGCRIRSHPGQVSSHLNGQPDVTRELLLLGHTHAQVLRNNHGYERFIAQCGAFALALSLQQWRRARSLSRDHWNIAFGERVGLWYLGVCLVRSLLLRGMLKSIGFRVRSVDPVRPISVANGGE